jgi:branched-chain amino acid transport system permease protein
MDAWKHPSFWITIGLILIAGLIPIFTDDPLWRENMFSLLLVVTMASSLNIILGYTGYVSFGHIVFYGFGGYVGFYLISAHGLPLWMAAIAGGITASLLALFLGLAVLRLKGAYFALATIGINVAMMALIKNLAIFGGPTGLSVNFSIYQDYGGPGQAKWYIFYIMFVLTLATVITSFIIKFSRFGLGLMVIREDEGAAMVLGVKTPILKAQAYAISAFFPGIAGVLFFFKNGNIEPPDAFPLHQSIEMIVMVMLGGQGTVLGPVIGAGAYEQLRSFLLTSDMFKDLQLTIAGLLLLLIVLFAPTGVVGWLRSHFDGLRKVLE